MKKLMIAACAVALAAVAPAATVTWGGAFATVDNDYLGAGSKAFLVFSSTALTTPTEVSELKVGGTLKEGGSIVQEYTFNAGDLEGATFSADYSGDFDKISGYYGVLVMDAADPKKVAFHNAGQATFVSELDNPVNLKYNPEWDTDNWMGETGYNVAVAPEPTSGLLLLLGVAGLALKRRRA